MGEVGQKGAACSDWPGACQHTPAHDNGRWTPEPAPADAVIALLAARAAAPVPHPAATDVGEDPMTSAVPDPTVEALSEAEWETRMARISPEAAAIAEDVWTDDEPTLAEYELTERILAARAAAPDAHLCSQCGERDAAMVKIGTTDGWCTVCLDEAAEPAPDALRVRIAGVLDDYAPTARRQRGCPDRCGCTDCEMVEDLRSLLEDGAQ